MQLPRHFGSAALAPFPPTFSLFLLSIMSAYFIAFTGGNESLTDLPVFVCCAQNYKNRLRLAKVIVKNKMSRFLWFSV